MTVIGLTGSTGAGKSTVAGVWQRLGAHLLNCDDIYHGLIKESKKLIWELEDNFAGVVDNGELNRKKLAEIVFADSDQLKLLNSIAHKYVVERVKLLVSKEKELGTKTIVIEAIYLIETDLAGMCDCIVGVIAPVEKRLKRIIGRDNIDEDHAWSRLRSQMGDDYYLQNCDYAIENDTSLKALEDKAVEYYYKLVRRDG